MEVGPICLRQRYFISHERSARDIQKDREVNMQTDRPWVNKRRSTHWTLIKKNYLNIGQFSLYKFSLNRTFRPNPHFYIAIIGSEYAVRVARVGKPV